MVEAAVAGIDLAERAELVEALSRSGAFSSAPARVLDPAAGRGVRALVRVPLVAAELVDGVGADPDDVEWIEADLGTESVLADRLLIRIITTLPASPGADEHGEPAVVNVVMGHGPVAPCPGETFPGGSQRADKPPCSAKRFLRASAVESCRGTESA
jgi:hypothetical protein